MGRQFHCGYFAGETNVAFERAVNMGLAKTEKELREETRARRAKQDLKNTPLPIKRRSSVHMRSKRRLFDDANVSDRYKRELNNLVSRRMINNLSNSKSMTDLRDIKSYSTDRSSLRNHSYSCIDLSTESSLRRSKSYTKIVGHEHSLDKAQESVRSTLKDIFTNTGSFSSRSISAISTENILRDLRNNNWPKEVGYLRREEQDKYLHDPCWRAKRIVEQYRPSEYKWRERLGMQEQNRSMSRSLSLPSVAGIESRDRLEYLNEKASTVSLFRLPMSKSSSASVFSLSTYYPSIKSIQSPIGNTRVGSGGISTDISSNSGSGYMKKAWRQLKVATDWLSNAATNQESRVSSAARWSTAASTNRFTNLRAKFA